MLNTGVLNPHVNSLSSRVRHTNTVVITDRGFRFWPMIETADISLLDDVPTALQLLVAMHGKFAIGKVWMAQVIVATADDLDPAAAPLTMQSRAPRPAVP